MDEHLTFQDCIKTRNDSSGWALSGIISKFKCYKDVGYKTFTNLLNGIVLPVLDYGSGVWGATCVKIRDLILNKAARYFLGVHRYSPNAVLHGDTGWLTDKYRRYHAILRFWNRLIGMPNDRVTKKIFNWDFENDRNGWCGDVKTILSLLDMSDVYQNQQPCDLNLALSKLESMCQLQWKQTLDLKPKLRTYQTFKEDYATEEYLNIFLTRYQRSLLAQFRVGVLPLRVETGRFNTLIDPAARNYRHLRLHERICQLCNMGSIEDEYHF